MERILLVDDELNLLNAFRRHLASRYEFITASSAKEALEAADKGGHVSVVISDMYMPGMQGAEFLGQMQQRHPDCVRVMLTGLADQKTAVQAINEGAVFRFLNKPCSVSELEDVLTDCLKHRAVVRMERELLQNTLGGIIKLLTDLLTSVDPDGIARAARQRRVLKELSKAAGVPSMELELAVMLAGIGRLTLPLDLLVKLGQGGSLSDAEQSAQARTTEASARLLKNIPRFERVATVLEAWTTGHEPTDKLLSPLVSLYGISHGITEAGLDSKSLGEALAGLRPPTRESERRMVAKLLGGAIAGGGAASSEGYSIGLSELCPGQRLLEDVLDLAGKLLLRKGFIISPAVIERLKNHQELVGVAVPLLVEERIPTRG